MECVVIQNRIFSDSCWERASHSPLRVNCRKNVLLCFMYFLTHPASYVGTLNLMAWIPGPSILTLSLGLMMKRFSGSLSEHGFFFIVLRKLNARS